MNFHLLNTESQEFINSNLNADLATLLLKGTSIDHVDTKALIEQIEAKNKSKKKLPTWFNHRNIYYPNKLNIEQTSSETTAAYKASLMDGKTIIDLTGGFGVDTFYFSKGFQSVTHCEINEELSEIVRHNFKQLNVENVEIIPTDGIAFLKQSNKTYDWMYVDPSRRHDSKGKVFLLKDCLPNIPQELDGLFEHANNIMIKTSPLLDISLGIDELNYVQSVHVVASNNEVKELLWILKKGFTGDILLETVNLKPESEETFKFHFLEEATATANFGLPLHYLYEPNAAILKAGGFNSVASQWQVLKLHKHSHLYTSKHLVDFPGRSFKIENRVPFHKKTIKNLGISKANITTRNFPESVEQIRKLFKIKDGGEVYLFFTTNINDEKIMLICSKVK